MNRVITNKIGKIAIFIFFAFNCLCIQEARAVDLSVSLDAAGSKSGFANLGLAKIDSPVEIAAWVIGNVLIMLGVVFFVLVVYGGILWLTAGGNEEQVGKAKKIIVNATIGVAVIVCSGLISYNVAKLIELGPLPQAGG